MSQRRISATTTTRIYCRPGCGSRPQPRNVRRFVSAVAAEAAGYRACLRCQPHREPHAFHHAGLSDHVARALRGITSGWCDEVGEIDELAGAVGVDHQVLVADFEREIGASPAVVQRSRVAHAARTLIENSALSARAVATGVGLKSSAELDQLLTDVFGLVLVDLRTRRPPRLVEHTRRSSPGFAVPIAYWPGVDVDSTFRYLGSRAIPGIEGVDTGTYRRIIVAANGRMAEVEISASSGDSLTLKVDDAEQHDAPGEILGLMSRTRALFALDEPLASDTAGLWSDPILGPHVRANPGLRLAGSWDPFETAIRIVLGQQVTVAAASTLTGRLVERFGSLHPTALAGIDPEGLGMPKARARAVANLAQAVLDRTVDLRGLRSLDESVESLISVVGVGPWTAQLIAARVLRQSDAFPPKDLGLMRAYEALGGSEPVEVAALAWRPHRAAAIAYLWSAD